MNLSEYIYMPEIACNDHVKVNILQLMTPEKVSFVFSSYINNVLLLFRQDVHWINHTNVQDQLYTIGLIICWKKWEFIMKLKWNQAIIFQFQNLNHMSHLQGSIFLNGINLVIFDFLLVYYFLLHRQFLLLYNFLYNLFSFFINWFKLYSDNSV